MTNAALAFVVVLAACDGLNLSDSPSWEEFQRSTYREPWQGGVYIVDGDTPVVDDKALHELWQNRFAGGQALAVHREGGLDARWSEAQKRQITYCIDNAFAARKAQVIAAMQAATDHGWETFADVDFVYFPAHDFLCNTLNTNVVFDVRPVFGQPYLARAFFPNDPRSSRSVLIDSSSFNSAWPLAGILGHETGHALGFRHEHTRPEAGTCFEDEDWRALTPYDSASAMHYPQCNGTGDDLAFTAVDAEGAAALYGPPGSGGGGGGGTVSEHHQAGQIPAGTWFYLDSVSVKPGSAFDVVMKGVGDPDLYVRFDNRPTTTQYHCRPYLSGPDESCAIDVPANATTAHVAIYGYTAGSYDVTVRWVQSSGGGVPALVINEILADPGTVVDANGDGIVSASDDEMIELVNAGDAPIDLGGATIADSYSVRLTLPIGLTLPAKRALVLFGGGAPRALGTEVQLVTGRLYLNNEGDTITVYDRTGRELAKATYDVTAAQDQSLVRKTELDATAPLVRHTEVSSLRASPGRRSDGGLF